MQRQWDVLVIGGGPAGLSAASAAAECGLEVMLLDEQESPGGQIYRSVTGPNGAKHFIESQDRKDGLELIHRFQESGAHYRPGTVVWFAEPGRVICSQEGRSREIKAQVLVVATGAMERPVPFPGWTLPGVMGAGAADVLFKNAGVTPEGPVVLAGNGPLIPLVGSHLLHQGVDLKAILDTGSLISKLPALMHLPSALRDFPLLWKGAKLVSQLVAHGVPIISGAGHIAAEGNHCLSHVTYRKSGRSHRIQAATLLVHGGVIPRTHVSRMLKLDHAWNRVQRYWYPVCDSSGSSSIDHIYVAGDGAFVRGAIASACKGELTGIDAARRLQVLSAPEARTKKTSVNRRLKKNLAARAFVDAWFSPNPAIFRLPDETLVCRCEGVRVGDIRQAVAEGCLDVNEIKIRTRCGMGPCQGRMCGPAAGEIAGSILGVEADTAGALNIRPPIRPIPFREICEFLPASIQGDNE